ncbi:hypothetical protein HK405_013037, partial [Cladochytrium tenue]
MARANVKTAVAARLLDQSKSVREAAVELVGLGLRAAPVGSPLFVEYFGLLVPRILDVGQAVRKRVMKLMKEVCSTVLIQFAESGAALPDHLLARLVDVACKIIGRLHDEEDSVRDLAKRLLYELWFTPFKHPAWPSGAASTSLAPPALPPPSSLAVALHAPHLFHPPPRLTSDPLEPLLQQHAPREAAYATLPVAARREIDLRARLLAAVVAALAADPLAAASAAAAGAAVVTAPADPIGDVLRAVVNGDVAKSALRDALAVARSLVEAVVERVLALEEQNDK